ncbi:hypothetical protein BACCIP111883_02885 [Sutcliffiella rhizosphaerae]|uniref:Uncharacterized protein n=1 Tax=Sutcliffiella rhizosphaerae TaxID=2880967 RepID=A0ABN8AAA1_9BACI|nr:hypothetical protein BACCIP111883_02885 [Sutcliffiella rhizosphaerae]
MQKELHIFYEKGTLVDGIFLLLNYDDDFSHAFSLYVTQIVSIRERSS